MSSDQVAKLAATLDVLTNAVQFLVAERVSMQPPAVQGELLRVLQRSLSVPMPCDAMLPGAAAILQTDLARWSPIVATNLIDDVRRQLGRPSEGVTQIASARSRTISEPSSEMAERTRREDPRRPAGALEDGRSAA